MFDPTLDRFPKEIEEEMKEAEKRGVANPLRCFTCGDRGELDGCRECGHRL